jgi:hypothetical protein
MSDRGIYIAVEKIGDESFGLSVYADSSALFSIVADGAIQCVRILEPSEDGADIAIAGDARAWFDRELAAGRARVKREKNAVMLAERVELALADVPPDPVEIDPKRLVARIKARLDGAT